MSIKRPDLPIEVEDVLDSTGNYYSEWVDSSKILSVRVAFTYSGGNAVSAAIQESNDTVAIVRASSGVTSGSEVNLVGRYFRLWLNGSTPGETVHAAVRAVS
jgi:hypothetical protein